METRFVELMAELFQMDEAEALDFGLYRIIRRHNREVRSFLGEIISEKEAKTLQGGQLAELLGVQRAVASGLGVTALTRKTLLPEMRVLSARDGFPALEPIRIGLFYKHQRLSDAGLMLVDSLISHMDEAAEPDVPKANRAR